MSSGEPEAPGRPKRVDPTDVFSPWYPVAPSEPEVVAPRRKTINAAPSDARVLRGGLAAAIGLAIGLAILAIPFRGGHIDDALLLVTNQLFAHLPFQKLQYTAMDLELAQVVLSAGLVMLWMARNRRRWSRNFALLAFGSSVILYVLLRFAQHFVHRPRPLFQLDILPLVDSYTWNLVKSNFTHLGSLPSDHAALYAFAALLAFTVSRRAGIILTAIAVWASAYRIGIGFHYPSDVLSGALLGLTLAVVLVRYRSLVEPHLKPVHQWFKRSPSVAYAVAFVVLADFSQHFPIAKGLIQDLLGLHMFH